MHPRALFFILILAAVCPALLAPATALSQSAPAADKASSKASKSKELAARKAFGAGDWAKALELYSDLYAETLHPIYLRNIARSHQRLKDPQKAIDLFQEYLAKGKPEADERAEIEGFIKEMERLREQQAVERAAAATPKVVATGAETAISTPAVGVARPVPPPENKNALVLTEAHQPAPVYQRWWFWTGVGAVVVAGAVTAFALTREPTPRKVCPVTQCM